MHVKALRSQLIPDMAAYPAYVERNPRMLALVGSAGARTLIAVPVLKDGELIGAMTIYRQEVRRSRLISWPSA